MVSQSSSFASCSLRLLLILALLLATTRNVAVEASRVEVAIDPATGMMLVKTNATAPWSYACTSNAVMDTNSVIGACKMAGFRYVYSASAITIGVAPAQDKKVAAGLLSCSASPTLANAQPCVFEDFTVGLPSCAGDYTKTLKLKCTGVRTGGEFGVFMGSGSSTATVDTYMRIDPVRDRLQLRRIFQSVWYDTCPLSSASTSSSAISSKLCKSFGFESGGEFFDTQFVSMTSPLAVTSGTDCSGAVSSIAASVNALYFNIDDFSQTCTIDPLSSFAASCAANAAPVGLHCHSDVMGSLSGEFFVKTPAFQNRLMLRVAADDYTASTAASAETGYFRGICTQGMTQVDADQLCKIMGRSTDQVSFSSGASFAAVSYSPSVPSVLPVSSQVLLASLACSQTNAVSLGVCSYISATSASCSINTDQAQLECIANDDSGSAVVKFVAYVVPFVVGVCIISVIAMRYRMYQGQKEQLRRLEKEQAAKNNTNNGNNNINQQETNAARTEDDREYSEASDPAPFFPPPNQYQHTQAALQQQQEQQQIYIAVASPTLPLNNSALLPTTNAVISTPPAFKSQSRLISASNEHVPMPPPVNGYNSQPQQPPHGYVSEVRV